MRASKQMAVKSSLRGLMVACALVVSAVSVAHAADKDQEQVKRLKLQMRQMQQEQFANAEAQAKAQADKAELESTLKAAKSEASATKAAAAAASKRVSSLSAEIQSLKNEKSALTEQVAQLQKQLEEQKLAAKTESDRLQGQVAEHKGEIQALNTKGEQCRKDNMALHAVGTDLLALYENKGFGEVFGSKEPLLQLGRVKLENLSASYRDKLDAARAQP